MTAWGTGPNFVLIPSFAAPFLTMIIHFDMVQVCACTMHFYKNVLMSSDM